jgi:hypothetical protein
MLKLYAHKDRSLAKHLQEAAEGAALLLREDAERGGPVWPVAFAINAHHAGLHDRSNLQKRTNFWDKARAAEGHLFGDPDWQETFWPVKSFGSNLPEWLDRLPVATPGERAVKPAGSGAFRRSHDGLQALLGIPVPVTFFGHSHIQGRLRPIR